ncbi:MAG: reverse transcriptase-like protein [Candidatus Acidiferrales bacterium]
MKRFTKNAGRLFHEPAASAPIGPVHVAQIDGAARGNPGPAAYAVVLRGPDGARIESFGKYIGRATNNVAEYFGLIAALDAAAAREIRRLRVESDSELLVRQMQGHYKVRSADLRPLHERAQKAAKTLEYFALEHIPRERNADADAVANAALDNTAGRNAAPAPIARPIRTRARYAGGTLVPVMPLDLVEGDEVIVTIEPIRRTKPG